jgi:processive 1,2-diacylglycerol beta-glucosyltransferase
LRKKTVLLLSEGFGAGHTQAANALAVSLRQLSGQIQPRVIELGALLHPNITSWILSAYRKTITSRPKWVGMVYRSQHKKSISRLTQLALHRILYTHTEEVLQQLQPDVIVCTHPIPNAIISRLKRLGMEVPLYTVITDYDAHGTWVSREVNKYFVSTPEVKQKLLSRGISDPCVEVTGIPVHPQFRERHDRQELRNKFGLKNIPTVLIMGGGWGLVDNRDLFAYMANWRERIQLVICMGNNEKSRIRLSEDRLFRHENIHILGYTNHIDKLMEVSDLLITKPGGMTCAEGMAKSIPMLFYNPIPGQEEENCQYLINQGYGEQIESLDAVDRWFRLLIDNHPSLLQRRAHLNESADKLSRCSCAEAIVRLLDQPMMTSQR